MINKKTGFRPPKHKLPIFNYRPNSDYTLFDKINELIDITIEILIMYIELVVAEIDDDKEYYELVLEELKQLITTEDKIYNELLDIETSTEKIIERVSKLLKLCHPEIQKGYRSLILDRISIYLKNRNYINPFKSMSKYPDIAAEENTKIICYQYNYDTKQYLIKFTNHALEDCPEELKPDLIMYKYDYIFSAKSFELLLLTSQEESPKLSGKEKAILFGHDKETVEKIYFENSLEIIRTLISEISQQITFAMIGQCSPYTLLDKYEDRNLLESYLSVITKEEVGEIQKIIFKERPSRGIMQEFYDLFELYSKKSSGKKLDHN